MWVEKEDKRGELLPKFCQKGSGSTCVEARACFPADPLFFLTACFSALVHQEALGFMLQLVSLSHAGLVAAFAMIVAQRFLFSCSAPLLVTAVIHLNKTSRATTSIMGSRAVYNC